MNKNQILFWGAPGTGKTFEAREFAINVIHPDLYKELYEVNKSYNTGVSNEELNLQIVDKAFEIFFKYNKELNICESKFLNERKYKPGKTCYRNMSALNKVMSILIDKNDTSILRENWPDRGPSTFSQFSRSITNFDLGVEETLEGNKKGIRLNENGIRIKSEYESFINHNEINLYNLRNLPSFAKDEILNSLKNTNSYNMSMWKMTIIGGLWFIVKNGYIFKYRKPQNIVRNEKENELLKICLGYEAEDNDFLTWLVQYLMDLGLVVESESKDARYMKIYYLSEEGKSLLRDMDIVLKSIERIDFDYEETKNESITNSDKRYIVKNEFISKRSKVKELFSMYRDSEDNKIDMITLHPSFEYENFIEGISVETTDTGVRYYNNSGILKDICYKALKNLIKNNLKNQIENEEITEEIKEDVLKNIKDWKTCYEKYRELESTLSWDYCDNFVLIIDEINRGDIAKIFGETITLLETDKRLGSENEQVVKLPFTNDIFGIPKNIFILATMNTSDRSIAKMDIALRRRFGFVKCNPKLDLVKELYTFVPSEYDNRNLLFESVDAIKNINKKLSKIKFIGEGKTIGHSYLMGKDVFVDEDIIHIWMYDIIPLLEEYFLGEYDAIIDVIPEKFIENETGNFIYKSKNDILDLIGELAIIDEEE